MQAQRAGTGADAHGVQLHCRAQQRFHRMITHCGTSLLQGVRCDQYRVVLQLQSLGDVVATDRPDGQPKCCRLDALQRCSIGDLNG
ncbi:hypothetical protein D3C80_1852780 [compost metagenome]